MRRHVHIYRVTGLWEYNLEEDDCKNGDVMELALQYASSSPSEMRLPDCNLIAIVPGDQRSGMSPEARRR